MNYTENRNGEIFTLVYDYDSNGNFIGGHMEKKEDTELVSYDIRKIVGTTKTGKVKTVSIDTVTRRVNSRRNFLKGVRSMFNAGYVIRKVI